MSECELLFSCAVVNIVSAVYRDTCLTASKFQWFKGDKKPQVWGKEASSVSLVMFADVVVFYFNNSKPCAQRTGLHCQGSALGHHKEMRREVGGGGLNLNRIWSEVSWICKAWVDTQRGITTQKCVIYTTVCHNIKSYVPMPLMIVLLSHILYIKTHSKMCMCDVTVYVTLMGVMLPYVFYIIVTHMWHIYIPWIHDDKGL